MAADRLKCTSRRAEEDAARRDFTINGMFFDPEASKVIDFVGGRADLEARLDSGDRRSRRSVSRRIVCGCCARFASRPSSGSRSRPQTWEALRGECAPSITEISAERIREELVRIFLSPQSRARLGFARRQRIDGARFCRKSRR